MGGRGQCRSPSKEGKVGLSKYSVQTKHTINRAVTGCITTANHDVTPDDPTTTARTTLMNAHTHTPTHPHTHVQVQGNPKHPS